MCKDSSLTVFTLRKDCLTRGIFNPHDVVNDIMTVPVIKVRSPRQTTRRRVIRTM